jgi:ATP-dependent helicase/nuclease subunit A
MGARVLPDQAARDRIEQDLDRNLLVEAGAGSGKTESLARRMAAGIAAGRYQVERMAAVTFTRKAAAELRGRFQGELERRLAEEPDPARRTRMEAALGALERLFAGTIHAFCAHLLRERPVEAGVAPGFLELDDLEDRLVRRAAWRRYCEAERGQGSARYRALAEVGLVPKDLDDAFDVVCRFPEVTFPAAASRIPDPRPAARGLAAFWRALGALVPDPLPEGSTCKLQERAADLRARLRVADLVDPPQLAELLARWASPPGAVKKWWSDKSRATRAEALAAAFARDVAGPFVAAWRQHCYRVGVEFLQGGRAVAEAARRRALALSYEDLLQVAARLLRERADVRAALQAKYRWLFIDEFQDTDPIQAEVIGLLAAVPTPGVTGPLDWTQVDLRPGALFVVGDPKQSIYRFRRADIETYGRVRARIEATGGATVPLTTSFRSLPALCDWANSVFPRFFPRRPTPQQPAFDRLDPVRDAGEAGRTGVRQLVIPATVERDALTAADADAIARVIRTEVDVHRRTWGDFLVLTCRRRALDAYARALEARGVPVEVSGASGFAESASVPILADLLRVLGDPSDQPALVGVLRGRLFGVSDVELFRHRQSGWPLWLTGPLDDAAVGPVADALRRLREMYRWTRRLPAPAAVERILEATGWLAAAVAESPGTAEGGHLLHAVDRIRAVTEAGGTLADAVEALEVDLESTEVESIPLEPGRRDVVRVMNLHKAKGLEAAVVFLADPLAGLPEQVDVRIVRGDGPPQGYFPIVRRLERDWGTQREVLAEPTDWAAHETAELAYLRAERQRLLYVAATRAKDLLVISRWAGSGREAGRPWEAFAPFLRDVPRLRVPAVVALPPPRRRTDP